MQNVILISVDCLRADHAGYTKDAKLKPPTMIDLADKGYAYENCICQAPFTTTSHASMLTGLYPFEHGVRHLYGEQLDENTKMIQHDMRDRGYSTHALVSCFHMTHTEFQSGFDSFRYEPTVEDDNGRGQYSTAKTTTDRAIDILKKHDKTFLFIHYFDIHTHTGYEYEQLYRDEIMEVDKQISRLVDFCDDDTLFIITGDHGKKWSGEHNFPYLNPRNPDVDPLPCKMTDISGGHGAELYDESIRVPLIAWSSEQSSLYSKIGTYVHPVQTVDIRSLIKFELGEEEQFKDKRSEFAYMETYSPDQLFKQGIPQIGIRTGEWKLICYQTELDKSNRGLVPAELYNLEDDPSEEQNIIKDESLRAFKLFWQLLAINRDNMPVVDEIPLNDKVKKRLEGLGYI